MKLVTSFSYAQVAGVPVYVGFDPIVSDAKPADFFRKCGGVESLVTDPAMATLLSGVLGLPVPVFKGEIKLTQSECLILADYKGPTLPEGATSLPDGATLTWVMLDINVDD